jgi:hypothetical protein
VTGRAGIPITRVIVVSTAANTCFYLNRCLIIQSIKRVRHANPLQDVYPTLSVFDRFSGFSEFLQYFKRIRPIMRASESGVVAIPITGQNAFFIVHVSLVFQAITKQNG